MRSVVLALALVALAAAPASAGDLTVSGVVDVHPDGTVYLRFRVPPGPLTRPALPIRLAFDSPALARKVRKLDGEFVTINGQLLAPAAKRTVGVEAVLLDSDDP